MADSASPGPALPLRAPRPDERDALLEFIAVLNQPGEQHCLHFADTVVGIRADIERDEIDLGTDFLLATDASGWLGTAGLSRDGEQGWLLGPWARDATDGATRRALLQALMQRPGLALLRSFSDVRCVAINAELASAGFVPRGGGQVMQAHRSAWRESDAVLSDHAVGAAIDTDDAALADLHRAEFPDSWLAADDLLSHARKHGQMLVARDATHGLLGSLCLSFNSALPEADVEFLAVRSVARRRGVGRALLQAALREAFRGARCERVNLVVSDTNPDARRLYEASGFEHLFSGTGKRWAAQVDVAAGDASNA
jgi:ribosomal protein S18 acetylase RimI-like enzyme